MKKLKFISFGEILWDVISGKEYLGGAPLNLGIHASFLGADSYLISAIGKDKRGAALLKKLKPYPLETSLIQTLKKYPTGWVDVSLSAAGSPSFVIHENVAFDNILFNKKTERILRTNVFDVFCFGTLAQRGKISQNTLYKILSQIKSKEMFYDVNLRQNYYDKKTVRKSLEYATVVKLNDEEVLKLKKLLYPKNNLTEKNFCQRLIKDYKLKIIMVTLGAKGCNLYTPKNNFHAPGIKVSVADTVGSGDAFSAAFLVTYLTTKNLKLAAGFANKIGAFVATQQGAIPPENLYLQKIKKIAKKIT